MPLVNYSSDSDSAPDEPVPKRRKSSSQPTQSDLPPLPDAFHDLYASTVRQSVVDDPTLHQGRKRLNPHVVGQWPSHVYVEWIPNQTQHAALTELLNPIRETLGEDVELHQFLTSPLGAPLPLHISLSRPLSLSTAEKDAFLEQVTRRIHHDGLSPFAVHPAGINWFRSPDSNRTFLVLSVAGNDKEEPNRELMSLLRACNGVAGKLGKALLYHRDDKAAKGNEFHLSIGWTFDEPDDDTKNETAKLLGGKLGKDMREWDVVTGSVKVKIGNVVSSVALAGESGRDNEKSTLILE